MFCLHNIYKQNMLKFSINQAYCHSDMKSNIQITQLTVKNMNKLNNLKYTKKPQNTDPVK